MRKYILTVAVFAIVTRCRTPDPYELYQEQKKFEELESGSRSGWRRVIP